MNTWYCFFGLEFFFFCFSFLSLLFCYMFLLLLSFSSYETCSVVFLHILSYSLSVCIFRMLFEGPKTKLYLLVVENNRELDLTVIHVVDFFFRLPAHRARIFQSSLNFQFICLFIILDCWLSSYSSRNFFWVFIIIVFCVFF